MYGRNIEGATGEQICEASKAASIHDFITKQPQTYNTMVGERGLR
jgi:ATP-binding cassette, subfamily B, heavy metal transporter